MKDGGNKLSICIVVHNEEGMIKRCLESVKYIADEIIVVMDGEQKDKTERICRDYTDRIFKGKHCGFSEAHLSFAFQKAKGDWVLKIDADEFLLSQNASKIRGLMENENIDGYFFLWRLWNGKKYITKNKPFKPVLFRKSKMFFIGVTHGIMQSYGNVKKINISLEHQPSYNNWCLGVFMFKHLKRARINARILLKNFNEISKFNYQYKNFSSEIRIRKKLCFLFPLFAIYKFASNYVNGEKNISAAKVSFYDGLYELYLGYYMCIEKLKSLRH